MASPLTSSWPAARLSSLPSLATQGQEGTGGHSKACQSMSRQPRPLGGAGGPGGPPRHPQTLAAPLSWPPPSSDSPGTVTWTSLDRHKRHVVWAPAW